MTGEKRRQFQAEMTLKYGDGSARKAERLFGWGRKNVQLGLEEKRSGMICVGWQSTHSGAKKWEELFPEAAQAWREIAEAHAQQAPSLKTSIADTRLTAAEAISQLRSQGIEESGIPAPSTMAVILNRMGYRLRKVLKAKPQKAVRPRVAVRRKTKAIRFAPCTLTKTNSPNRCHLWQDQPQRSKTKWKSQRFKPGL